MTPQGFQSNPKHHTTNFEHLIILPSAFCCTHFFSRNPFFKAIAYFGKPLGKKTTPTFLLETNEYLYFPVCSSHLRHTGSPLFQSQLSKCN